MTLRDLRWRLAYAVWAPGSYVEHLQHEWQRPHLRRTTDVRARLRVVFGVEPRLPLWLRFLKTFVEAPSSWLSNAIYSDWVVDERATLNYWKNLNRKSE